MIINFMLVYIGFFFLFWIFNINRKEMYEFIRYILILGKRKNKM